MGDEFAGDFYDNAVMKPRLNFGRRTAAEKILSRFDISSDSFLLTADKSWIPRTISKFVNEIYFAASESLVRANIRIPGQRFGRRGMESPKRPEKRNIR